MPIDLSRDEIAEANELLRKQKESCFNRLWNENKVLRHKISELEESQKTPNNSAMLELLCEMRDLLSVEESFELAMNIKSILLVLDEKIAQLQQ